MEKCNRRVFAAGVLLTCLPLFTTLAIAAEFETGSVELNRTIDSSSGGGPSAWKTVNLQASYSGPPVIIAGPVTHANDHSLGVRIRNVTASDFEIALTSPCDSADADPNAAGNACPPPSPGNSPPWNTETVRYLAVPPGVWQFPDGTKIEAATVSSVSDVRSGIGSGNAGVGVSFQHTYASRPVVLHTVNTANDDAWITSSVFGPGNSTGNPPDTSGFTIALEGAEVTASHGSEDIGWVAIEPADGTNNTHPYSAAVSGGLDSPRHDDGCASQGSFSGFSATPDVVAAHNTMQGTNGGWLRFCGAAVTTGGINVHVDEDQVNDGERTGLTEASSWFAFEADSIGLLVPGGSVTPFFARDTFEAYTAGNSIAGGNGGVSWSGAWSGAGGGIESVVDTSGNPLSFTDTGDTVDGDGLALRLAGNDDNAATRDLAQSISSPFVYAAMLVRFEGAQNDNDFLSLWFDDSDPDNAPNFGIKMNRGNGSGPEDLFARSKQNNAVFDTDIVSGRTYFLVARIEKAGSSAYDKVSLWVDPTDLGHGSPPPVTAETAVDSSGLAAFQTIGFRSVNLDAGDSVTIDELRLGTSWAEVTAPDQVPLQRGRVRIDTQSSGAFANVSLSGFDQAPIVLATDTADGSGPAGARVRGVSASGFELAPVEPSAEDGPHEPLDIDYIAVGEVQAGERKLYLLDDLDGFAEMRRHATQSYQTKLLGGSSWDALDYLTDFASAPAVLGQVQTDANESGNPPSTSSVPWLQTTVSDVDPDGFDVALERAESAAGSVSADETIGLVIMADGSSGTIAGLDYEALVSADSVQGFNNGCFTTSFGSAFGDEPVVVANRNTRDGGDGGWIRRCSLSAGSVGLTVDEDRDADGERNHTTEQAAILAVTGVTGAGLDHYEIVHDGTAVTCGAESITITGHDAGDNPIDPGNITLSLDTSTGEGTWARVITGSGTLSDGTAGDGAASYTFPGNGETSVTLAFNYTTVSEATDPETVNFDVQGGGGASEAAPEDPDLVISRAGFRVTDGSGNAQTVPDQIAAKPSDTAPGAVSLALQAVRASDSDPSQCEPFFPDGSDVDIELGAECVDPSTCAGIELDVTNNGSTTAIDTSDDDGTSGAASYEAVTLRFGPNAEAPLVLEYDDAGRIQFHARYNIPLDDGTPSGNFMIGASNAYVMRPFGFHVAAAGNPGAASGGGPGYVAAGDGFTVEVSAVGWAGGDDADADGIPDGYGNNDPTDNADIDPAGDNAVLPNFGAESEDDAVAIGSRLWLPNGGNDPALAGATTVPESAFEDPGDVGPGAGSSGARYLEVGIIELRAGVDDGDYLGAGNVFGRSGPVGRFFPNHFVQTVSETGMFANGCGGVFTYTGQSFGYLVEPELTISARNSDDAVTQNYTGTFERLDAGEVDRTAPVADGTTNGRDANPLPVTATINAGSLAENGDGSFSYTFDSSDGFRYIRDNNARIEPFSSDLTTTIDSIVESEDGVSATTLNDVTPGSATMRFGRLAIDAAAGSELAPIGQPVRAEIWNNGTWQTHADDDCTTLVLADEVQLDNGGTTVSGDQSIAVGGGTSDLVSNTPDPLALAGGQATLTFAAPGSGNTGFVDTTLRLGATLPWLQGDWDDADGAEDGPFDDDPTARATFGIFSGNPNWIHLRRVQ